MSTSFGGVVDAARRGTIGRRAFLAAATAIGLGPRDALSELPPHLRRIWTARPRVGVVVPEQIVAPPQTVAGQFAIQVEWKGLSDDSFPAAGERVGWSLSRRVYRKDNGAQIVVATSEFALAT